MNKQQELIKMVKELYEKIEHLDFLFDSKGEIKNFDLDSDGLKAFTAENIVSMIQLAYESLQNLKDMNSYRPKK